MSKQTNNDVGIILINKFRFKNQEVSIEVLSKNTENNIFFYAINFRVRFGSNNLFVFVHPIHATEMMKIGRIFNEITYDFAQSEIAKSSGLSFDQGAYIIY